jgi:hypothetical protein
VGVSREERRPGSSSIIIRMSGPIEIFSPHPPEECFFRLTAAVDSDSVFNLFRSKPIAGIVSSSSLRLHKPIRRNSYRRVLSATMRSSEGGTLISGKFGIRPVARFLSILGVGAAVLVATSMPLSGPAVIQTVSRGDRPLFPEVAFALLPIGWMLGVNLLLLYLTRNDPRFITNFLIQTLDGKVVSPNVCPATS